MAAKVVVASGVLFAEAEKINLTYSDCGAASTHAKITGLSPTTIDMPGKATIVGTGDLDSDQTGAHFQLKVKKAGIPLVSGKGNICEDTTISLPLGAGSFTVKALDCPAKAGQVSVEVDLDILSDLFDDGENSLLDIHIEANADDTGDQVICLDVAASLAEDVTLASELSCLDDGECALDTRDCCSGKFHSTIKCGGAVASKRCGCVAEGDCALKLEDCCSGVWHSTLKCGAGISGGRCDASTQVV
jgi:hypothetical protein